MISSMRGAVAKAGQRGNASDCFPPARLKTADADRLMAEVLDLIDSKDLVTHDPSVANGSCAVGSHQTLKTPGAEEEPSRPIPAPGFSFPHRSASLDDRGSRDAGIAELIDQLNSPNWEERADALKTLPQAASEASSAGESSDMLKGTVIPHLSDWNESVRVAAFECLSMVARRGDDLALRAAVRGLDDHVDLVRKAAAQCISRVARYNDDSTIAALFRRFESPVEEVRILALVTPPPDAAHAALHPHFAPHARIRHVVYALAASPLLLPHTPLLLPNSCCPLCSCSLPPSLFAAHHCMHPLHAASSLSSCSISRSPLALPAFPPPLAAHRARVT